jgi:hypothetical protein
VGDPVFKLLLFSSFRGPAKTGTTKADEVLIQDKPFTRAEKIPPGQMESEFIRLA